MTPWWPKIKCGVVKCHSATAMLMVVDDAIKIGLLLLLLMIDSQKNNL